MGQVSELTRLIHPPSAPYSACGEWQRAEASLGLTLPEDYKRVVETYGTGRFFGFLWVYSPFDPAPEWALSNQIRVTADNLRAYKLEGFGVPFPVYPEPAGLVNFGSTENGNLLNWATEGDPNGWGVAIWDPDYLVLRPFFELTLSALLLRLARHHQLATPDGDIFPEDVFLAPSFVPVKHHG